MARLCEPRGEGRSGGPRQGCTQEGHNKLLAVGIHYRNQVSGLDARAAEGLGKLVKRREQGRLSARVERQALVALLRPTCVARPINSPRFKLGPPLPPSNAGELDEPVSASTSVRRGSSDAPIEQQICIEISYKLTRRSRDLLAVNSGRSRVEKKATTRPHLNKAER